VGKERPRSVVLDAGALIAFERGDERMRALVRLALETKCALLVPAGVVGQVFRDGSRQARLRALLNGPTTEVPALDQPLAEAAGRLCGRTRTRDVIDASVILTARRARAEAIHDLLERASVRIAAHRSSISSRILRSPSAPWVSSASPRRASSEWGRRSLRRPHRPRRRRRGLTSGRAHAAEAARPAKGGPGHVTRSAAPKPIAAWRRHRGELVAGPAVSGSSRRLSTHSSAANATTTPSGASNENVLKHAFSRSPSGPESSTPRLAA
jgi:hypothetical protein